MVDNMPTQLLEDLQKLNALLSHGHIKDNAFLDLKNRYIEVTKQELLLDSQEMQY